MSGEGGVEDQVAQAEATAPASLTTAITTTTTTTAVINNNSTTGTTTTPCTTSPPPPQEAEAPPTSPAPPQSAQAPPLSSSTPTTTTITSTPTTPTSVAPPVWTSTTTTTTTPATQDAIAPEEEDADEESNNICDRGGSPERVQITAEQLAALTKEELLEKWALQERFLEHQQNKMEVLEREVEELRSARENEERLKGQLAELQRKEQYHIMRLSSKELELQDLGAQVQELKSISVGVGGLKHCLLDPAVNLLFERLKRDLDTARTKMEETQNELSAWKFTPDSNTGKQLMAKCRLLIKENEELGRMITSGRLAKLEGDLALQRNFSEELKKSQSELDEFLLEMDEDTEGMQGTIYYLQQQLRQAKERIAQLSAQLAVTQAPVTQPTDDSSAQVVTEGASENNSEAEQTEERTQVPQPNGEAPHLDPQSSEVSDSDAMISDALTSDAVASDAVQSDAVASDAIQSDAVMSDAVQSDVIAEAPLTNGRKRTQSEMDEGAELTEGVDETREDFVGQADDITQTPCKRARTDVEAEGSGAREEEEKTAVVENGLIESE